MKIGIITQPLHTNYGGLLQNYALQKVLTDLGHSVTTINKDIINIYNLRLDVKLRWSIKQLIKKHIGRAYFPLYNEYKKIRHNCDDFVDKYIKTTNRYYTQKGLAKIIRSYKFDGYVVGSDQVWRPCYSYNIYNDFLDFCQDENNIKRIAYAASFGVDNWEFNETQTKECSRLAKLFDAISVREDSGENLCKKFLGVNATHVLDPTMLLEKDDYIKLVEENNEPLSQGDLFCYFLDNNEKKENIRKIIEQEQGLNGFQVKIGRHTYLLEKNKDINNLILSAPTKWLRAFMDAELVLTDSFHGCVFSIIFNKPFWVIENKERGNARFDSLLKLFKLENRRVDIENATYIDFSSPIDWQEVNSIKKDWQKKSINFIKESL